MGCNSSKPGQYVKSRTKTQPFPNSNKPPSPSTTTPTSQQIPQQKPVLASTALNNVSRGRKNNFKTSAQDMEGIIRVGDTNIDLTTLSMTDMVANAMTLVKLVINLIDNNLAKNQLMKAVLRRMHSLEPCFDELQKKNSTLTKDPIINLIHIINRMKALCEKMTSENKSCWEKFKDIVTVHSQIERLSELNELLSRVLSDLQVSLQVEEAKKMNEALTQLKELSAQGAKIFAALEKNDKVLPLAKKALKNEEAFIFWLECLPDKYLEEEENFKILFAAYILQKYQVELKPKDMQKIVGLIKKDEGLTTKINASEVNIFFESLPLKVPWGNIGSIEHEIETLKEKKAIEAEQVQKEEQKQLSEKLKNLESEETPQEKKLLTNKDYLRLLVQDALLKNDKKKSHLQFRNIFIHTQTGEIQGFGTLGKKESFTMSGRILPDGQVELQLSLQNEEPLDLDGKVKIDETFISLKCKVDKCRLEIDLDLDYWFGYYEHEEELYDMAVFFKIIGNQVSGLSVDEVGLAFWKGTMDSSEFTMVKQYVSQHKVDYKGQVQKKSTITSIQGKWIIEDLSDNFYLSYGAEADEFSDDAESDYDEDCENNEMKDLDAPELNLCSKGHELKWDTTEKGAYVDGYGCKNCERHASASVGRWHCSKCSYDVCPKCKKIPEDLAETCNKNHPLHWDNTQGNYPIPFYDCDVCTTTRRIARGRWHCRECQYDICGKCRTPPFVEELAEDS